MGNVWTARARLVSAVISELFILRKQKSLLLQYCPVCRRRIVAAVRDRVPRDVQRCGVKLKNERPTWCHLLFYFTSYVLNMFRTLIYPSAGACDYSVGLLNWSYCSWFDVCWSFGVAGLERYPCCRLKRKESSLPCLQKPATCPWYESDESNPHCPIRVCTFVLYGLRALSI